MRPATEQPLGPGTAGPPETKAFDVPDAMRRLAGDHVPVPAWRNDDGVLTCALLREGESEPTLYLKWAAPGVTARFSAEVERLRWARAYTPVPRVVDAGVGTEHGDWLITEAIRGDSAVSERWRAQPAIAVRAIGEGLRAFHDNLPTQSCPFSWSVESRVRRAREKFDAGHEYRPSAFKQDRHGLSPVEALRRLQDAPPVDRLVVCHGDPCSPNTLLDATGNWVGHVDLDSMGVADRWADIAVASWSAEWNYGPQWGAAVLDAYGAEPDEERTYFYRLLWDMA